MNNKNSIIAKMKSAGTYRVEFSQTIHVLSKMLDDYDAAEKKFKDSGGGFVVKHTNKAGATNAIKNPYYLIIETLRASILIYTRELGLTPAGLKKINDEMEVKKKRVSKLEMVLSQLEKE